MENSDNRIYYSKKPKICPKCGSEKIASILWGYPVFNDELNKQLDAGEVRLGGCVIDFNKAHSWECRSCRTHFYYQKPESKNKTIAKIHF